MATAKSHHVLPGESGGWIVKREGAERASRRFGNLRDAVVWGRAVTRRQRTELVIHWPPEVMRTRRSIHVIWFPTGWSVWKAGAGRASRRFTAQQEAIEWGRELARKLKMDLYVHRPDATVQQKISYESDALSWADPDTRRSTLTRHA